MGIAIEYILNRLNLIYARMQRGAIRAWVLVWDNLLVSIKMHHVAALYYICSAPVLTWAQAVGVGTGIEFISSILPFASWHMVVAVYCLCGYILATSDHAQSQAVAMIPAMFYAGAVLHGTIIGEISPGGYLAVIYLVCLVFATVVGVRMELNLRVLRQMMTRTDKEIRRIKDDAAAVQSFAEKQRKKNQEIQAVIETIPGTFVRMMPDDLQGMIEDLKSRERS